MDIRVQTLERLNNNPFVRLEYNLNYVITWRTDVARNLHIQRKDVGCVIRHASKESIIRHSEFINSYYRVPGRADSTIYDVCVEEFL